MGINMSLYCGEKGKQSLMWEERGKVSSVEERSTNAMLGEGSVYGY